MYMGALAQTEATKDPLGRKFFEASVYRNLADIVGQLENRLPRFKHKVIPLFPRPAVYGHENSLTEFVLGKYSFRDEGVVPAIWYLWTHVLGHKWRGGSMGKYYEGIGRAKQQYSSSGIDFVANDILREVINLERELNRVHIPMPGDFRSWANKVRAFTNDIVSWSTPCRMERREVNRGQWTETKVVRVCERAHGYGAEVARLWEELQKMDGWLNTIKSSLKKAELRSEELKRKQQEAAEKAYQAALEKKRKEAAAKKAAEKAAEKAKKNVEDEAKDKAAEEAAEETKQTVNESNKDLSPEEIREIYKQQLTIALQRQREELLNSEQSEQVNNTETENGAKNNLPIWLLIGGATLALMESK